MSGASPSRSTLLRLESIGGRAPCPAISTSSFSKAAAVAVCACCSSSVCVSSSRSLPSLPRLHYRLLTPCPAPASLNTYISRNIYIYIYGWAGADKAALEGVKKLLPVLCECVGLSGGKMLFFPDFHEVPGAACVQGASAARCKHAASEMQAR